MAYDSWDDAMLWYGSLIGYMAGVKAACKDEDKSDLLIGMAQTQAKLEAIEREDAKLREYVTKLEQENIVLSSDNCDLLCDMAPMQEQSVRLRRLVQRMWPVFIGEKRATFADRLHVRAEIDELGVDG